MDPILETMLTGWLDKTPELRDVPEFAPDGEYAGIRAFTYESAPLKGMRTKAFAYLGIPDHAPGKRLPAIVLLHGGLGHADLPWIKRWNDLGFAAISMDNTGFFPTKRNAHACCSDWARTMHEPFTEDGFVNGPNNDELGFSDGPVGDQWLYHALVTAILAHNILRSLPEVDNSRIGVTGISWGSVITSLLIGYDTRFAFAMPVYGSGYLTKPVCRVWISDLFEKAPAAKRYWLAEERFDRVKIPVLWLCWNDDWAFDYRSNLRSYRETIPHAPGGRFLMLHEMYHGHNEGYRQAELDQFALAAVGLGHPLADFDGAPQGPIVNLRVKLPAGAFITGAKLYYLTEKQTFEKFPKYFNIDMVNRREFWKSRSCAVECDRISGSAPSDATTVYAEVTYRMDGRDLRATSLCWEREA